MPVPEGRQTKETKCIVNTQSVRLFVLVTISGRTCIVLMRIVVGKKKKAKEKKEVKGKGEIKGAESAN